MLEIKSTSAKREQFEQWLTGFWEGDGNCRAYVNNQGYYVPSVSIVQKDADMLKYIRDQLGFGKVYQINDVHQLDVRKQEQFAYMLELLCKYLVSEQSADKVNKTFEKFNLSVRAEQHKPSMPWIVGFSDAEGCITWNGYGALQMQIAQNGSDVLEDIKSFVGGNLTRGHTTYKGEKRYNYRLQLYGESLRNFIPSVLKYSCYVQKCSELITKIHVLALDGGYIWSKWAKELLAQEGGE